MTNSKSIVGKRRETRNRKKKEKKKDPGDKIIFGGANVGRELNNILKSSIFRYINEVLYTTTSDQAIELFKDAQNFDIYHSGYSQQLRQWPLDPVTIIIEHLNGIKERMTLADLGCGNARLSQMAPKNIKVSSYDLVAANNNVTVCDIAKVPVKDATFNINVFCLSLMGTNLEDFIRESNRILKVNGIMFILDVESRFDGKSDEFAKSVCKYGFKTLLNEVVKDGFFRLIKFEKISSLNGKDKLPKIFNLKACAYKKR